MKQTKIVATVGPASETKDILRKMVENGMNVARLNFSHGEHKWHKEIISRIRELSYELNIPIGVIADLQGPRIRTDIAETIILKKGESVRISDVSRKNVFISDDKEKEVKTSSAEMKLVFLDVEEVIADIQKDQKILIEDGLIELVVTKKSDNFVVARSLNDCVIKNHKGVIIPGVALKLPVLSEKDLRDLKFVLNEGVDFIALSFVESAEDIELARTKMREIAAEMARLPQIIAKIERKKAIKNLSSIIKVTDAVMVARGDLGIEMPESEVVILQKCIIA